MNESHPLYCFYACLHSTLDAPWLFLSFSMTDLFLKVWVCCSCHLYQLHFQLLTFLSCFLLAYFVAAARTGDSFEATARCQLVWYLSWLIVPIELNLFSSIAKASQAWRLALWTVSRINVVSRPLSPPNARRASRVRWAHSLLLTSILFYIYRSDHV